MVVYLFNDCWQMQIDLLYVCVHAGKRERYYDQYYKAHSYIPFTLTHARKIFRLIKQYGDDLTIQKSENFINLYDKEAGAPRIVEQWEKA